MDAVLFDLDDTLCAYRTPASVLLERAFREADVEPCFAMADFFGAYETFLGAAETFDGVREACFASLAAAAGEPPAAGRAVARAYAATRDHRDVAFLDGAREAVEVLADEYRLGVVTNGPPDMQAEKLDALGIREAFSVVVHGGHDAPAKPAPEPFHLAIDALGAPPDRAVHVGNSLESDVDGARAAGLRSAWLAPGPDADPGEHAPDYVLRSLAELAEPPWSAAP